MPSKKMTAKKSTGGSAPRVVITLEAADDVSDASQSDEMDVASDGSHHNDSQIRSSAAANVRVSSASIAWTYLPRSSTPSWPMTSFSNQESRRRQENGPSRLPYFGFHYSDGRPVLDRFLNIRATLELSLRAQISSAPVLFVHLKIVDYDATGGSFDLAYDFLKPYFPCGGLERREVTFDIATTAKAANYQRSVDSMVRALKEQGKWDRVVIGISTTRTTTTATPFAGYDGKKDSSLHASIIYHSQTVAGASSITRPNHTYGSFAAVGLFNNIESFKTLQTSIFAFALLTEFYSSHRMSAAVAFTAPRFQPSFTSHLLLAFAEI
ncbi:uncharacterized protein EDB91DRAFT_1089592, partial [Suillus paluster]|uniref:uncharacterized protein n=1 Tax=Suillus paluster TaxID=48578 RepID=UPI001B88403C